MYESQAAVTRAFQIIAAAALGVEVKITVREAVELIDGQLEVIRSLVWGPRGPGRGPSGNP
jgi:hypothetical protein